VAKTSHGNYSIGMFDINSEKRANILNCFTDINSEIETFKSVKILDKEIEINYYICTD
jgi:hypothetical protein